MPSGQTCIIWPKEMTHTPPLPLAKVSLKSDSLHLNRWKGFKVTVESKQNEGIMTF